MKKNVETLRSLNILEECRQGLANDGDYDVNSQQKGYLEKLDERLNKMDAERLVELWARWELGDRSWAKSIIYYYNKLK